MAFVTWALTGKNWLRAAEKWRWTAKDIWSLPFPNTVSCTKAVRNHHFEKPGEWGRVRRRNKLCRHVLDYTTGGSKYWCFRYPGATSSTAGGKTSSLSVFTSLRSQQVTLLHNIVYCLNFSPVVPPPKIAHLRVSSLDICLWLTYVENRQILARNIVVYRC